MVYEDDVQLRKQAQLPHQLFMFALGGQLLIGPAAIFLGVGQAGILLPLAWSLLFFFYTWMRSRGEHPWFVSMHWQLALSRYKYLYAGYAVTLVFFLFSILVGANVDPDSPKALLTLAITRVGIMPVIIMIFACLVIENGGLSMAINGELPERFAARQPR